MSEAPLPPPFAAAPTERASEPRARVNAARPGQAASSLVSSPPTSPPPSSPPFPNSPPPPSSPSRPLSYPTGKAAPCSGYTEEEEEQRQQEKSEPRAGDRPKTDRLGGAKPERNRSGSGANTPEVTIGPPDSPVRTLSRRRSLPSSIVFIYIYERERKALKREEKKFFFQ